MKFFKKLTGVFLVLVIAVLTLAPAGYAVTYPQGITQQQAAEAMTKTDVMLHTLLSETEGKSLADVIVPLVLGDATLSSLAKTMYSLGEENSQTFSTIGLAITPADVAKNLYNYPDVQLKLMSAASWSQVDLSQAYWGIETVSEFSDAAVALFAPMNELLYTILCGGSYSLNPLIGIQGSKGYEKSVIKIFSKLGMETCTNPELFYAQAQADRSSMIRNLVNDVANYLTYVCSAPATILSTKLPGFAHYIENGGLDQAIGELVDPLRIKILGIPTPVKIGSVMELAQQGEAGTSFDFNIDIGSFSASGTLQTAPFDMSELAAFSDENMDVYAVNTADSFMYIFKWIIETVRLNVGSIPQMLSGMELGMDSAQMSQLLTNLFSKSTDELIAVYINLLTQQSGKVNPYIWSFNSITPATVTYTPNLGQEKYQRVLDGIDTLIGDLVKESGEAKSLRKLLAPDVYSNAVVTKLVTGIYGLLESEEAATLMSLAGLDLSPSALADRLTEDSYASTRETLYTVTSYEELAKLNVNWGFKNGSRDGFIRAVSAVFRPLDPMLKMLLCGDSLTVLGSVAFYGSDGYNTGVIPLLEAIGCDYDEIRTFDEFMKEARQADVMFPIVQAVVTLIERMLEYPVYTITGILPNLMYFINNGGIEICINNLLYPVTSVVDSLGLSQQINLQELTKSVDKDKLIDDFIKGLDLGIKLPELDLNQFASIGTLISAQTKRTQVGQPMVIQYVQADKTGVLITLLRYMVEIMKTPGNESIIDSFMASSADNEMFATYSSDIGTQLEAMSVDETVEWLYKIFFRERATVEETGEEDYTPTIIYNEKENNASKVTVIVCILVLLAAAVVIAVLNKEKLLELINKIKAKKEEEE